MKKHIFDMISRYMLNLYQFPQYWGSGTWTDGTELQPWRETDSETYTETNTAYLMIQFNFTNEHLNYVINLEIVQCSYNLKI